MGEIAGDVKANLFDISRGDDVATEDFRSVVGEDLTARYEGEVDKKDAMSNAVA